MAGWNFADVWEAVADAQPDAPAQAHGDLRRTWGELDRRADGVGAALLSAGLRHQDTVALLLHNGVEYLECAFGALKAGLILVNTNYRYGPDELEYLWSDADARAVVFHGALTGTVDAVRGRLPGVRAWLHADDGSGPCPEWAQPYEQAAASSDGRTRGSWGRSADDLILIYTGGTTGRPKGVMWRQHDLYRVSDVAKDPAEQDLGHVAARVTDGRDGPVGIPGAPLMHGTGYVFAGTILSRGGTVVTLTASGFDVEELLDAVQRERVSALCIVGDAFCRPIVDALDAEPGRWDVSTLRAVSSAGMVWSPALKERLLVHAPDAILVDLLNSSEASGMGRSVSSRREAVGPTRFRLGENAFVIDDDGRPVEPGSGVVGRLAVRGHLPLGYWKDPQKTAETFPEVEGVRCSVPGDLATVEADGSVGLVGRGSTCVNTGGEKVYPEEVEERLLLHEDVTDVVVCGLPDERFGEVVAALVATRGDTTVEDLQEHCRGALAGYKVPRVVVLADDVGRGPSGKADRPAVRERLVQEQAGAAAGDGA